MTILDAIPDAKCVVVTTPQEISLADVRKALDFLKVVKADVLGLVENMSGLFCPHCGEEIDLFKKGGGEALAKQEGLNFLGAIRSIRHGRRRGQGTSHRIHARRHPGEGRIPQAPPKPCGKRRKPNSTVKWNIFLKSLLGEGQTLPSYPPLPQQERMLPSFKSPLSPL